MGNTNKKQTKCLVIGIDNSGKSTLINQLKPQYERSNELYATVGFQVEKFKHNKTNFIMFDMSGQSKYRNLWLHYINEISSIIFVIDSCDTMRVCIVRDELDILLQQPYIQKNIHIPILFYANKCDLSKSLTPSQLSDVLQLNKLCHNRQWTIVASNALNGTGVEEGIQWLTTHVTG